jgi:hypothetical protein
VRNVRYLLRTATADTTAVANNELLLVHRLHEVCLAFHAVELDVRVDNIVFMSLFVLLYLLQKRLRFNLNSIILSLYCFLLFDQEPISRGVWFLLFQLFVNF